MWEQGQWDLAVVDLKLVLAAQGCNGCGWDGEKVGVGRGLVRGILLPGSPTCDVLHGRLDITTVQLLDLCGMFSFFLSLGS